MSTLVLSNAYKNKKYLLKNFKVKKSIIIIIILFGVSLAYTQEIIDFDSSEWQKVYGETSEYLGRKSFDGIAFLKDVEFENGVIEFDIALTGQRSYPGIRFRIQSRNDFEHFYIRPHRVGLYPDALQYAPTINGIGEWQLWNGKGYTSEVSLPENEWIHVKMEIKDDRARIFFNKDKKPAFIINELKHGKSRGTIGVAGQANGTAYFSNFSYYKDDNLDFGEPPVKDIPVGMIKNWEISQAFNAMDVKFDKTPEQQGITDIVWQKVEADEYGLVDVGKYVARLGRAPDMIFARTIINVEEDTIMEYRYGYSDAICIFLNQQAQCFGNSSYQQRDPSFLGIIGLNDAVFLPLKKGDNELLVMVAESFGGWGFMFQNGNEVFFEDGITKVWETEKEFATSESVLYDPEREVIYVTNFDQFGMGNPQVSQSISKLSLEGEIIEMDWVSSLNNPLGMTISNDELYVAERKGIAIIDLDKGEIIERIEVPGSVFLNDIAVDDNGNIFISDSRKNIIWKITNKKAEEFLSYPDVEDPNVLYFHNNKLLIGNSGDSWLKELDIETKKITNVASFPEGFIDGIRVDNNGNYIVSLWKGKIYRVKDSGEIELIFHTENKGYFTADFEYIPEKNLLIIPTFFENRVVGYKTDW